MIVKFIKRKGFYSNTLDFGSGPGILTPELSKYSLRVVSLDKDDAVNLSSKYDLIVCSSVLEFCHLDHTLKMLKIMLKPCGKLVVASPMTNKVTDWYFKKIGDKNQRHSYEDIIEAVQRYFKIRRVDTWLGLYFCLEAI